MVYVYIITNKLQRLYYCYLLVVVLIHLNKYCYSDIMLWFKVSKKKNNVVGYNINKLLQLL